MRCQDQCTMHRHQRLLFLWRQQHRYGDPHAYPRQSRLELLSFLDTLISEVKYISVYRNIIFITKLSLNIIAMISLIIFFLYEFYRWNLWGFTTAWMVSVEILSKVLNHSSNKIFYYIVGDLYLINGTKFLVKHKYKIIIIINKDNTK